MKDQPQSPPSQSEPQPVAYDSEGRALYHHPSSSGESRNQSQSQQTTSNQASPSSPRQPTSIVNTRPEAYQGQNFNPQIRAQYANEPSFVHTTRSHNPYVPEISDVLRRKHEESRKQFPLLNLSEGEFVLLQIRRHPIGIVMPIGITLFIVVLLLVTLILTPDFYAADSHLVSVLPPISTMVGAILLLILFAGIVGGVAVWVYMKNRFFLTNESIIQEIQQGLFSRHEQTVSLGSIEDASFKQYGIIPHMFNYGLMRLSTEGEETTYRFNYVENPKQQVAIVNNAVENFKNGRPVGVEFLDE